MSAELKAQDFSWQQTMYRIKDPKVTIPFYEKNFGMHHLAHYDFPQWKFTVYFLVSVKDGETLPATNSDEAKKLLWSMRGTALELTHNHGDEDKDITYNNGNVEPHRGFGHIAFLTPDVYAATDKLLAAGVAFKKKPDEGRMKGLAFAYDPDGYWIELIKRHPDADFKCEYNLAQTMLRVKDPKKSLQFYTEFLGMTLLETKHFEEAKFSLYFLANLPEGETVAEGDGNDYMKKMFNPVLELTHNHGTESDQAFSYHNGNSDPRGFGHIGYLVNDVNKATEALIAQGVKFQKKPEDGNMHHIAFALDPDGYWVELIDRNMAL